MGSVAVPHLWDWLLGAFLTAGVIVLVGWDRAESLGWRGVLLLLGACMVLAPLLVPMPTIYLGPKHSGLWLTGLATPAGVGGQVLIEDMGCSGTCLIPCLGEVVGVAGDPVPLHEESDLPATVPVGMILVDREVGHVTAVENETFVRLESRTAPSLWRPWWLAR